MTKTLTSLQSLKEKALADIETKAEYDALNDEFEQINADLTQQKTGTKE